MSIIAKIGPLELSIIFFFAVIILYRIQARPESRIATALVFIFSAKFMSAFINGFLISESTKLSLGQLDTILAYLILAFAFLEILIIRHATNWKSFDLCILIGLLGFGILNLFWILSSGFKISSNNLLYLLPIILFLFARPTKADLKFLPYFGVVMILMVFITALLKYQNPLFPYSQSDYGLGGPYQNRIWDLFELEERFRGPYFHPNQLGIQITFLSLLVLLKSSKLYIFILPISFTLLFLSSSRTSILALVAGVALRLYFDTNKSDQASSLHTEQDFSKGYSRRKLNLKSFITGFALAIFIALTIREIVTGNTTGSGRLQNFQERISVIRENLLFGEGPSLVSVSITENTVLTVLSFYGLIGLALYISIAFVFILKFRELPHDKKELPLITFGIFFIASTGEALLTGTPGDTGLYYLLVLLTLTRVGSSRKVLLQP